MKQILLFLLALPLYCAAQQSPAVCSSQPEYRQFDFWIGEWEVYGPKGKAGDSKIELILDSCVILENWTGKGSRGKSFNIYNVATKQWQQTWVENDGQTTEFLRGKGETDKMTFWADHVTAPDGKNFMRRLTFYKKDNNKVRQHGERSDDNGNTWTTEYDLEYRRKM